MPERTEQEKRDAAFALINAHRMRVDLEHLELNLAWQLQRNEAHQRAHVS